MSKPIHTSGHLDDRIGFDTVTVDLSLVIEILAKLGVVDSAVMHFGSSSIVREMR